MGNQVTDLQQNGIRSPNFPNNPAIQITAIQVKTTVEVYRVDESKIMGWPTQTNGFGQVYINGVPISPTNPPAPGGRSGGSVVATSLLMSYSYEYDLNVCTQKATLTFSGPNWNGKPKYGN
jgi:hypothetical protein